jgi:S-adenosylmethionine synthetase
MSAAPYLFTSESVSEGHPDKVCDQLSDCLLDAYLSQDPHARVAIETAVTKNTVILMGEVSTPHALSNQERETLVRQHLKKINYRQEGFHWEKVTIYDHIHSQSPDIAQGVVKKDLPLMGAGDQGLMFGYACDETPSYMPASLDYAHRLLRNIFTDIHDGTLQNLGPDAKSQVTLWYQDDHPIGLADVVISIQHAPSLSQQQVRELLTPYIMNLFPKPWITKKTKSHINPTGTFVIGGPVGDTGLTGRKIIVDTYGGAAPHGGGAFSGKDPSKVDRSGAYMARYLAKNIVAAGLAKRCTLQIAYCIGEADPVSVMINTHGTGRVNYGDLIMALQQMVDLRPYGICKHLGLFRPIYLPTATYGHFGQTPQEKGSFSWERLDLVDHLRAFFNLPQEKTGT